MAPFSGGLLPGENKTGGACTNQFFQPGGDELTPASLWVN
jgi:hypothetical protein